MAKSKRKKRRRPRRPLPAKATPKPVEPARTASAARGGSSAGSSARDGTVARRKVDDRPQAPWGSFPLVEACVLAGIILMVIGLIRSSPATIMAGILVAALGGLELSIREHFAGYRSHTTLLAGLAFVVTLVATSYFTDLIVLFCLLIGLVVFAITAWFCRRAFKRASGGYAFKFGGLRG